MPPSDEGGAEYCEAEGEKTTPPSFASQNPPPLTSGGYMLQNHLRCAIILVAHLLFWGGRMKKAKKYIYPFIFSICFFVTYIVLTLILEMVLPSGDYAGLAYAFIALLIWIFIAMPIYCFKYCKFICEEKHKLLFGFYNSLVISLCHTGPFLISAIPGNDADIIIKITLALFGWLAICTYVSYLIRINTTKELNENNLRETGDSVTKV